MALLRKGYDRTIGVAFLGFVLLGIPGSLLGIAWPSIRDGFGLSQSAVGTYLLIETVGYLFSSFNSGPFVSRMGIGRFLLLAYLFRGLGLLMIFLAPSWEVMLLFGLAVGLGSGSIDGGLNTYVAGYNNTRLMNWLHACFGLGATLAPLVITGLFNLGFSWRWGYAMAGSLHFTVVVAIFFTLSQWHIFELDDDPTTGQSVKAAPMLATLRLPLVWVGIMLFALIGGLEMSTGQWSFALFTESRGIAVSIAGVWVSIFWGSFTLGRIAFGAIGDAIPINWQLRGCLTGVILGALVMWTNPASIANAIGLIIIGVGLAPVFPGMVTATSMRLGGRHAANAIGAQVGAAGAGVAIYPWIAGLLAERSSHGQRVFVDMLSIDFGNLVRDPGLEILGPYLLLLAIIMFILFESSIFLGGRRAEPEKAGAVLPTDA